MIESDQLSAVSHTDDSAAEMISGEAWITTTHRHSLWGTHRREVSVCFIGVYIGVLDPRMPKMA
jgi:hypothetical protein